MIPAGYLLKRVVAAPEWMAAPAVRHVHSVSGCVSPAFLDYVPLWRHNGWWLFDDPGTLRDAALAHGIAPDSCTLFYYEVFGQEYDEGAQRWRAVGPEPGVPTAVVVPPRSRLGGYDVVTFSLGNAPECSPLSCNALARELGANPRALFDTFAATHAAVEAGAFRDTEPGPFRIFAVHTLDLPAEG